MTNNPKPMNTNDRTKHTPGPWTYIYGRCSLDLKGNCGNTLIAEFPCLAREDGVAYHPGEEDAANLRLIAAAPELAEALRDILTTVECYCIIPSNGTGRNGRCMVCKARAALRKAGVE